jgi:hypothetical protein
MSHGNPFSCWYLRKFCRSVTFDGDFLALDGGSAQCADDGEDGRAALDVVDRPRGRGYDQARAIS